MPSSPASGLRGDFLAQLVHVGDAAHRLLAMQDRDPRSPSYGSFHYAYWRDKTSEFADARFQEAGAALGLLAHPAFADLGKSRGWPAADTLAAACHAGLANLRRLQYPSGCYDEWYKGERGFAATAFTTFAYAAAAIHLGSAMASATRTLLVETLAPAAGWLERCDDLVKTNHEVVAAAALAAFFKVDGDTRWHRAALSKMDRSLAVQTPEGWFPELDGMDFGYSALVLDYLMQYRRMSGDGRAQAAASRLLHFLLPHLHPDISFSSEGGSCRNAYGGQSGYVLLAADDSAARAVTCGLLALEDSRTRILAYLADDLRLARWSILPLIGALDLLEQAADVTPAAELPYPQGWTVHPSAAVAAHHRGDCHVYVPFAGGAVTRVYQGADIKLDDLGLDALKDGTAFTSLSYSGSRTAEFSDSTVSVVFDVGRAKYFFPGFAMRLLLRLGSATETTSRLTRAFIDRYRRRAKTAINQSSASVQTGGAGFRLTRSVAVDANRIVVTDSLAADDGATIELRLRPMPVDQKKHYSTEPGGSLTIRKTVDLTTGTLLVEAA
jgi:hypothetical protein